jgi:transposase-like protein
MRPIRRAWTPEENERLKAMIAKGDPPFRMVAAFKRNLISVRSQARKLGIHFPSIRQTRREMNEAQKVSAPAHTLMGSRLAD